MNFPMEGGGVPMAPEADASDGMLSMCSASGIPSGEPFSVLPFLVLRVNIYGSAVLTCMYKKVQAP